MNYKRNVVVCLRNCMIALLALGSSCMGKYPAYLRTELDIEKTPADWYAISIGELPLSLYPQLIKFREVEHVFFEGANGFATDAKLKALGAIAMSMPRLRDIGFGGSSEVTDVGVLALSAFPSLETLQLTGTAITDRTLDELARFPGLAGVNVQNCRRLSFDGLQRLVEQRSWRLAVSFSAEELSTEQVANLISKLPAKAYCGVVDQTMHLDESVLREVAAARGVVLDLRKVAKYPGYKE